jgi:hypothetical protein
MVNMTKSNVESRGLKIEDLDNVARGMPFYGMNCSAIRTTGSTASSRDWKAFR